MTSMESKRNEMLLYVRSKLLKKYKMQKVGKTERFITDKGVVFSVFQFPGENALCIEYAEDLRSAMQNAFEDGDRFYLDDFDGDSMVSAMLDEIEA